MGGISGVVQFRKKWEFEEKLGASMMKSMRHRGAHGKSISGGPGKVLSVQYGDSTWEKNVCSFEEQRRLIVMLDGEIYNCGDQCSFGEPGFSDAGIISQLYLKFGDGFAERIDGSYAIAVWDGNEQKLILVRDRLGYKPLFYLAQNSSIVFASEIKGILSCGYYERQIDLRAMNNFLSYGYITNPDTLFRSIKQVKPGHLVIFKGDKIEEKPYWKFTYRQEKSGDNEEYYREGFLTTFEHAVLRRLKRHPDCGAFLSGGLDTSGVVAMMHRLRREPFKVFTAGFKEEKYNEMGDAKIVSDYLGLKQYTVMVEHNKDFLRLLEEILWYHDAPFADTSAIPSYFAARLAKESVDVVLTGDFPDQLIGGSGHQVSLMFREKNDPFWKKVLREGTLGSLISGLPLRAESNSLFSKVKRYLYREAFSLEDQRVISNMPIPPLLKRCLYTEELLGVNREYDPLEISTAIYNEVEGESLLNKILYFDMFSWATDDLMVKVERMTSAHGLTAISPFHDREFVEFIATVPENLKIRGEVRKYIMKEALKSMLPEHTLNKRKQGFAMPIGDWLVGDFSDYVKDVLFDARTLNRGYFKKKPLVRMVERFLAGKSDYASGSEMAIISLITLELWHRIFMD